MKQYKKMDAHQTKASSIQIRRKWFERQKVHHHQHEYARIRGLVAQNVVNNGDSSVDGLRQIAKELKK